jgi:hypothetical protein
MIIERGEPSDRDYKAKKADTPASLSCFRSAAVPAPVAGRPTGAELPVFQDMTVSAVFMGND